MLTSRPTHGGGAPLGIDLEAGVAKITVRRPAPVAEPPVAEAPNPDSATGAPDRTEPAERDPVDAPPGR